MRVPGTVRPPAGPRRTASDGRSPPGTSSGPSVPARCAAGRSSGVGRPSTALRRANKGQSGCDGRADEAGPVSPAPPVLRAGGPYGRARPGWHGGV